MPVSLTLTIAIVSLEAESGMTTLYMEGGGQLLLQILRKSPTCIYWTMQFFQSSIFIHNHKVIIPNQWKKDIKINSVIIIIVFQIIIYEYSITYVCFHTWSPSKWPRPVTLGVQYNTLFMKSLSEHSFYPSKPPTSVVVRCIINLTIILFQ